MVEMIEALTEKMNEQFRQSEIRSKIHKQALSDQDIKKIIDGQHAKANEGVDAQI